MSEIHVRTIDRWLKWVAIVGPFMGFLFGIAAGAWGTYQAFKDNDHRISMIEGWKEKQDAFNQKTVEAIATLNTLTRTLK